MNHWRHLLAAFLVASRDPHFPARTSLGKSPLVLNMADLRDLYNTVKATNGTSMTCKSLQLLLSSRIPRSEDSHRVTPAALWSSSCGQDLRPPKTT